MGESRKMQMNVCIQVVILGEQNVARRVQGAEHKRHSTYIVVSVEIYRELLGKR
jgi:hypothetical protein